MRLLPGRSDFAIVLICLPKRLHSIRRMLVALPPGSRVFTLEPGGKATSILRIECNRFGRQIRTMAKSLLPGSNLIPHGSSLLSAQLDYRRSFWRDSARNSADNIPPGKGNCADKAPLRHSSTDRDLLSYHT